MHDLKHGAGYGKLTRFNSNTIPWNKGLIKYTDERVKQMGISTSISSKNKTLSTIHKENISKGICKAIVEKRLDLPKNSFGKIVKTETFKGRFCRFRSLKEYELSQILDLDDTVISFKYEALRIKYLFNGKYHITIPDFLVIRENSTEIIEVKMDRIINSSEKTEVKLLSMKNYADSLNWHFLYWNSLEFKEVLNNGNKICY